MYSIDYISGQIGSIDAKISNYNAAKIALENVQTICQGHIDNLDGSHKKLTGSSDLSAVKKDDVFEGEMADSLASRISTYQSDMGDLISNANEIIGGINTQLTTISDKISTLNTERSNWQNQLQNALNQP